MLGLWGGRAAESVPHGEAALQAVHADARLVRRDDLRRRSRSGAARCRARRRRVRRPRREHPPRVRAAPRSGGDNVADAQMASPAAQAGEPSAARCARAERAGGATDHRRPVRDRRRRTSRRPCSTCSAARSARPRAAARTTRRAATEPNGYAASALAIVLAADGDADGSRALVPQGRRTRVAPPTPTASWRCSAAALGQARIGEGRRAERGCARARARRRHRGSAARRGRPRRPRHAPRRRSAIPTPMPTSAARRQALEAMGVDEPGWDTAFRLAAGAPPDTARSSRPCRADSSAPSRPSASPGQAADYLLGCGVTRR